MGNCMSYYPVRTYPYRLFIAKSPTGQDEVFFDLFNAEASGVDLRIISVRPIVSGAVAVTGLLGIDLFLTFTSAIGTMGTAATRTGTSLTASTFGATNPKPGELDGNITARRLPTGGATTAAFITMSQVFTEETDPATYLDKDLLTGNFPEELIVPADTGIQVKQGVVASVGNIAFMIHFAVTPRQAP